MSFAAAVDPKWVTAGPWRQFGNWYLPPQSFSPLMLNPYAWYDVHLGGSAAQVADSSPNARAAMTNGAGSNAGRWLPYSSPVVSLPGVTLNNISCPSSGALNVSDDLEIATRVTLANWTPAARGVIASKWTSAGNISWSLNVDATGAFEWWDDRGGSTVFLSFAAPGGLVAGTPIWIKVTRVASTGAVTISWAPDASSEPTSWTLVGTGSSAAGALSTSTSPVRLGENSNGSFSLDGRIYRFIMRNAIGSSPVADFDPSSSAQAGMTDSYGNVWTVNRASAGRKSVVQSSAAGSPESLFLLGTDDYLTIPAAAFPNQASGQAWTVLTVGRQWGTPGVSFPRWMDSKASSLGTAKGMHIANVTTTAQMRTSIADGTTEKALTGGTFTFGQRVLSAVWRDASLNLGMTVNSTVTAPQSSAGVGDCSPPSSGLVGAAGGISTFGELEFRALLTFARVLTATEIAQLVAYYGGGL